MNTMISGLGIQGATNPIMAGGKIAGNVGMAQEAQGGDSLFGPMFSEALDNLQLQEGIKNDDSYNLAIGDIDDLGQMAANSQRAQIAFELLVQMRNKVLDSYQEIMRMNV